MADRQFYPHMKGRQAKLRIAREQAEAAEQERQFVERFEDRQAEREASALVSAVNAKLESPAAQRARELAERDKLDRMREIERAAAEIKVREGLVVTAHETVMEPTPEWFQHGDTESFTPELPDGTVRELKTVRRVLVPVVLRMLHADKIDSDQYRALVWYRECYERAGLLGSIPSVQIGREVFGGGPDRVLFTEMQQDAQWALREAKSDIPKHQVKFFEAVVIGNVPVTRASRFVRTKPAKALKIFRELAQLVTVKVEAMGFLA